jgi:hypothetical protein
MLPQSTGAAAGAAVRTPFALGAKSLGFATRVDPRLLEVAKLAITLSAQDFGFSAEQSRTVAEEAQEVREGFSHTMHSHHIIDCEPGWAAPGCSGAVDAVAWDGEKFVWEWPRQYVIAAAFKAASLRLGIPITWGGCWGKLMSEIPGDDAAAMKAAQSGFDGPHFELFRN